MDASSLMVIPYQFNKLFKIPILFHQTVHRLPVNASTFTCWDQCLAVTEVMWIEEEYSNTMQCTEHLEFALHATLLILVNLSGHQVTEMRPTGITNRLEETFTHIVAI